MFYYIFQPRRILWAVLLTAALGILVYNTTQHFIKLFEYEHITKMDIEFVHKLGKRYV